MAIIKDLMYMTKNTGRKTAKSLIKNYPIIFTGLIYSSILIMVSFILPFFWILSGIVMLILSSALISNYLYLLHCIIEHDRITQQDFKDGFKVFLRKIWTLLFMGFVANLGLDLFLRPFIVGAIGPIAYYMMINILVLILLNALPETVYQKSYAPFESVKYAVEFIRENWIEWFLPNLFFIGGLALITGSVVTGIFNTDISIAMIFDGPTGIFYYLLGQLWFSFMMIYRGYLFHLLNTSSRRKRLFMRKI